MKRAWNMISSVKRKSWMSLRLQQGTGMAAKLLEITEKAESLHILSDKEKLETLRRKLQELECIKQDMREELETVERRTNKRPRHELQNWFINVTRVKVEVQNIEQEMERGGLRSKLLGKLVEKVTEEVIELIIQSCRLRAGLIIEAQYNSGVVLLAPELVGQEFEENKHKIWECLMEDEGLTIGVFGMGGVGKTTLVAHIHNELLGVKENVYWITVSQDFSIGKLQNLIAKAIDFDASTEVDEKKIAAMLSKALSKKQKFILFLDDLWEHFSLEDVGIPISKENGCKLILTTRSLDICNRMDCQKTIKVKPLSEGEAWDLFQGKLGKQLPAQVREIAKCIARECDGLPLGIITMAGCMKGVDDISEWRNTLRELEESKVPEGDMETKVFRILKLSYDRLGTLALKKCFLCCALYPEDCSIRRMELIDHLIAEGVIVERSRQAEFDKGNTMLNKLEKVCLLEGGFDNRDYKCVKMHDLVRDMAIQLMKAHTLVSAESGVLDCKSWTSDLARISSMYNRTIEIPSNHSPTCPKLSVLLLQGTCLRWFPNPFFEKLHGLMILDLSYSDIEVLPASISGLSILTTLSLRRCKRLRRVPTLANLKALTKLDLSFTEVEEVPQGIEFLINLKYLGFFRTKLKKIPPGVLPKLSCLQVLLLDPRLIVKGDEVTSLRKLEALCCRIRDLKEFNTYFQSSTEGHGLSLRDRGFGSHLLKDYFLLIERKSHHTEDGYFGDKVFDVEEELEFVLGKRVILGTYRISSGGRAEFKFIEVQSYYTGWLCLETENDSTPEELHILNCVGIECLFSFSSSSLLENLEKIQIMDSMDLRVLFSAAPPGATVPNGTFCLLKTFYMWRCPSMKKLFPSGLLSNLQNLELISVGDCKNLEELIAIKEAEEESSNSSIFTLPKLNCFILSQLPELKSICPSNRKMSCNSLQVIRMDNCPKLKRIPMSLLSLDNDQRAPLPSLQGIMVRPKKWWQMVELDHPDAKSILSVLVSYEIPF